MTEDNYICRTADNELFMIYGCTDLDEARKFVGKGDTALELTDSELKALEIELGTKVIWE